jgi:hypothetical protein
MLRSQDAHTVALRLGDTAIDGWIALLSDRQTGHERELRASVFVHKATTGRPGAAVVRATTSVFGPLCRLVVAARRARVGLSVPVKAIRHVQAVNTFNRSALVPVRSGKSSRSNTVAHVVANLFTYSQNLQNTSWRLT